MCTAISYQGLHNYFGRNLDLDMHYQEEVTITPRAYPLHFREMPSMETHLAMIGMATVAQGYPLYYDASNEAGLSMAGLNFPGNAIYHPYDSDKNNVAPFELIPWILGQFKTVNEALPMLQNLNVVDVSFNKDLPNSPLHWLLSDKSRSVTLESTCEGLKIYQNPYGLLANNPPYPFHAENANQYLHLTSDEPENSFCSTLPLRRHSLGLGTVGLPGDYSSVSRFIRGTFVKGNSLPCQSAEEDIGQFFHILDAVAQPLGAVKTPHGYEMTVYSSCCDTDAGIYYYHTYQNRQITAVYMHHENLLSDKLIRYPLKWHQSFFKEN